MLYMTTRNHKDAYTAFRSLTENYAADGGGYVPFQMPALNSGELESFSRKSFTECVATILNLFFAPKLTGWDIEFAIGRNPIKLLPLNGKITVAELFYNPEGKYSYIVKAISDHLLQNRIQSSCPTAWAEISVRIATLFGIWGEMLKQEIIAPQDLLDISVSCDDHYTYIAATYARMLGLPLGTIIISCNEGNPLWDFLSRGEVKADAFKQAESEVVERLLEAFFGCQETNIYLSCRQEKKLYILNEEAYTRLKTNYFTATVSTARCASTASNIAKKDGRVLNKSAARSYAGVEDFRARCGIGRHALLIAESEK